MKWNEANKSKLKLRLISIQIQKLDSMSWIKFNEFIELKPQLVWFGFINFISLLSILIYY